MQKIKPLEHTPTFIQQINNANTIVIISHTNPDGDAVGSLLALYVVLKELGKEVNPILPNRFPEFLEFLPNTDKVYFASDKFQFCEKLVLNADLIIALDFNALKRIGDLSNAFIQSNAKKILIDHHLEPEKEYFDLIFSETAISSTSELLYWILNTVYSKTFLTKPIATCLYTGICTDTGSFSYSCNFITTYEAVLEIMKTGINAEEIHYQIYNTYSEERLRLLGYCLNDRMVIMKDIGAAYIYLTAEDLKRFDYKKGDSEGIVNYTLGIKSIYVGAMLIEQKNKVRISFRSKSDFDVNLFARKYFDGGGHKKASGANSFLSMQECIRILENAFLKELSV